MRRPAVLAVITSATLALASACQQQTATVSALPSAAAAKATIVVHVQAAGVVEPINPIDVKSKTSGLITQMPVEVGMLVKQGDLLAQLDPRDVRNQFNQAQADDVAVAAALNESRLKRVRAESLFANRVITLGSVDSARMSYAGAVANLVQSRSNLDLAKQHLEDATVRAPMSGTIVSRPATTGSIITAATGPNGGSTLMRVADLGRVRMRVNVDEVEMGNVHVGERATVQVDAFSERAFEGRVEKIEPQAVVTQGVTLFPVLVSISNEDRLLMPGMNGEVTIYAGEHPNVVTVPIDAVRKPNELGSVARIFHMTLDSLTMQLRPELVPSGGLTQTAGTFVVVMKPDSTYELRLVRTGSNDFRNVEVSGGLREGERVVVLGAVRSDKAVARPQLRLAADIQRSARTVRQAGATNP
jgi:HlyD family secretion protein